MATTDSDKNLNESTGKVMSSSSITTANVTSSYVTSQTSKRHVTSNPQVHTSTAGVSLFGDTICQLLQGISLAALSQESQQTKELSDSSPASRVTVDAAGEVGVSERTACSLCNSQFDGVHEQKQHYKSDWHLYNLKLRLRGGSGIVTEQRFADMIADDLSSISGSDASSSDSASESPPRETKLVKKRVLPQKTADVSEEDDEESYHVEGRGRRHPRVFLRNESGELLSVYRCATNLSIFF
jgi:hypothetical protein